MTKKVDDRCVDDRLGCLTRLSMVWNIQCPKGTRDYGRLKWKGEGIFVDSKMVEVVIIGWRLKETKKCRSGRVEKDNIFCVES